MQQAGFRQKSGSALQEVYRKRRCLITGHTGFKGSWLTMFLLSLEAEITGLALDPPSTPALFDLTGIGDRIQDHRCDVRDYKGLATLVDRTAPEIVFHLAAQPIVRCSYDDPKETFDVNVGGTVNLLEALRHCSSVRGIVVVTSDKCYENQEWVYAYRETDPMGGHDPYSASKAAAELVCASYRRSFFNAAGVGLATTRSGNVIGGGDWAKDRILPDAVRAAQAGKPLHMRNPYTVRPWLYVLDPLFGYLKLGSRLLEDCRHAGSFNFGPEPGACKTVQDLVESFYRSFGTGSFEDVSDAECEKPHEARMLQLAWEKSSCMLGWRPLLGFSQAVQHTGNWYRALADGESAFELCRTEIDWYRRKADESLSPLPEA